MTDSLAKRVVEGIENPTQNSEVSVFPEILFNEIINQLPEGKMKKYFHLYLAKCILHEIWIKAIKVKSKEWNLDQWGAFLTKIQFENLVNMLGCEQSRYDREVDMFEELMLNYPIKSTNADYGSVIKFILDKAPCQIEN